jgi:hypothetical protein
MTPEDAARGIIIIDTVPDINPDTGNSKTYVDVEKKWKEFTFLKLISKLKYEEKAFITGINGQDGSYLAEYLISLGYEVTWYSKKKQFLKTNKVD